MSTKAEEWALLKKSDGKILMGIGPFEELAECPREGVAFYKNSFALDEPRPWKVPSKVVEIDQWPEASESLEVQWDALTPNGFAEVFGEINEAILRGGIEKSVPVTTEMGTILSGDPSQLLSQLNLQDPAFYPYAWVTEKGGFCGRTPEILLNLRKGRLNTMALAGTARKEEADVFAFDEKEIREHEFVAQTLVANLSDVGMVKRADRRIMDLGSLVHFHTPIEVFLYGDFSVELLIKKLHPTPALGPLPRTGETLDQLYEWRERLGCPDHFGAPFGVYDRGVFHAVVAIRGLSWEGDRLSVPAGCGVIEASRLTNEWRELGLKRSAVKSAFKLVSTLAH